MNFFKRKFSFHEEDGFQVGFEDFGAASPSSQPPSAFSFQAIANKVSNTISAPTSPARTQESLAAAVERSLIAAGNGTPSRADALVVLVLDGPLVDWSKYFRNQSDQPIKVEQADFHEIDSQCTEYTAIIDIKSPGVHNRSFCPSAVLIGPMSTNRRSPSAQRIIRSLLAARIPFLNSNRATSAFMDFTNLKKELRRVTLPDGGRIPLLPSTHYPAFRYFHPSTSFPAVISISSSNSTIGKMRVENAEQLHDCEELIRAMSQEVEVEVEPFVDTKYDLHVQKIGKDFKTFVRRGISANWKSNVGSSVLEQTNTSERHKEWLRLICTIVGEMQLLSIDILVTREGREFVYGINDVLCYYGESQEDDRRAVASLLAKLVTPHGQMPRLFSREFTPGDFTPSSSTVSSPPARTISPPPSIQQTPTQNTTPLISQFQLQKQAPPGNTPRPVNGIALNGHDAKNGVVLPEAQIHAQPPLRPMSASSSSSFTNCANRGQPPEQGTLQNRRRENSGTKTMTSSTTSSSSDKESHSFAEDTMGQLKRTFAGIFGDVS